MIILKGTYALGFDENGNPVDFTHLWREDVLHTTLMQMGSEVLLPPLGVVHTPTVSYVNIWSNNYFHFVTECLGSVILTDPKSYENILVQGRVPTFIREGLGALRLGSRITSWSGTPQKYTNLVPPYQPRRQGYSLPKDLSLLQRLMQNSQVIGAPEQVYISREDAMERRIVNENEIPLKYKKVVCSSLTFTQQVRAFSNAKVIVGPHGAGMTNMIWAPPGCRVIEFFGSYTNECFEKLASTLGHEYVGIKCLPVGKYDIKIPGGLL